MIRRKVATINEQTLDRTKTRHIQVGLTVKCTAYMQPYRAHAVHCPSIQTVPGHRPTDRHALEARGDAPLSHNYIVLLEAHVDQCITVSVAVTGGSSVRCTTVLLPCPVHLASWSHCPVIRTLLCRPFSSWTCT